MDRQFKVYDSGIQYGYPTHTIFEPWNVKLVDSLKEKPDLVLFGGGEDINPVLYKHYNYLDTRFPDDLSSRERSEIGLYYNCVLQDIKMFGVCRGMQFLNVMSGGWLLQDIKSHAGPSHEISFNQKLIKQESIEVNSCHHQACIPAPPSVILATTPYVDGVGSLTYDFSSTDLPDEFSETILEAIMFTVRGRYGYALGVQWHPEYYSSHHPIPTMTRKLVDKFLFHSKMEIEHAVPV